MRKRQMTTSQPESWIEAFQKQASLEGMTFSEWVGEACLLLLEYQGGDPSKLCARTPKGRPPRSASEVSFTSGGRTTYQIKPPGSLEIVAKVEADAGLGFQLLKESGKVFTLAHGVWESATGLATLTFVPGNGTIDCFTNKTIVEVAL